MILRLDKILAPHWEAYCAQYAHRAVFNEHLPPGLERIDYALVAAEGDKPVAYMTVRELDAETVYLKRGGAFDPLEKLYRLPVYRMFLCWLDERYERMTTLVQNENVPYLKLAMAAGFRVIGIRTFDGEIFLELLRKKGA